MSSATPGPVDDPRVEALRSAFIERLDLPDADFGEAVHEGAWGDLSRASVALVVRAAPSDLELLVIKRASRVGDPWSGHMAFPGGRWSPDDATPRRTAERETCEEVGIELSRHGGFLGPLTEVRPRSGGPSIVISPYAYAVPAGTDTRPNHEVDAAFWIPLRTLSSPGAATEYLHALASGEELRFPAIAYESHVIWGLTHRIMTEFLEIVRTAGMGGGES